MYCKTLQNIPDEKENFLLYILFEKRQGQDREKKPHFRGEILLRTGESFYDRPDSDIKPASLQ